MAEQGSVEAALGDAERRMQRSIEHFEGEIETIRTGRANVSLVDNLSIDYYGAPTPLNQIATIATPDPRLITILPWDKSILGVIEREILKSDLGLTPGNDGQIIRLPIPPMTQERRQEMVKRLHRLREDAHVAIRNVRRDSIDQLRKAERDKEISQDELRRGQDRMQKATDSQVKQTDDITARKEAELLEV